MIYDILQKNFGNLKKQVSILGMKVTDIEIHKNWKRKRKITEKVKRSPDERHTNNMEASLKHFNDHRALSLICVHIHLLSSDLERHL